jgi:hypothetical protein
MKVLSYENRSEKEQMNQNVEADNFYSYRKLRGWQNKSGWKRG